MAIDRIDDIPSLVPKLLVDLMESGSITNAASALGVSQPAASKALKSAEHLLGTALVMRDRRPLSLTAEGKLIADYALQQLQKEQLLIRQLDAIKKSGAGLIRIASFGASASTHILPRYTRAIYRVFPNLRVEILEFNDDEALSALKEGRVDFAIVLDREDLDLDFIHIENDCLVALVHKNDPLANKDKLKSEDIIDRDFILTKGGSEPLIKEWFGCLYSRLKIQHTAVQLTSILALVRAGLGISIVAALAVPESHPDVCVVPISPEYPRQICLAKRSGGFYSYAARCVWEYLEKSII